MIWEIIVPNAGLQDPFRDNGVGGGGAGCCRYRHRTAAMMEVLLLCARWTLFEDLDATGWSEETRKALSAAPESDRP
jgi:hypothetical protein